ncbi:MAG TPA: hypothetical protein VIC32_00925, partial [Terriglobales bacterium]
GSSTADGAVDFIDPAATLDNGQPIAWSLRTGSISAAETIKQQRQGMELLGMVQVRARGAGAVQVEEIADGLDPVAFMSLNLPARLEGDLRGLALAQGEAIGLRFSSAGAAANLHLLSIYAFVRPTWLVRPGR